MKITTVGTLKKTQTNKKTTKNWTDIKETEEVNTM